MADQRRRRGRSGRGGRIPRKGEAPQVTVMPGEAFVSFPLQLGGPIAVESTLRDDAVSMGISDTLALERQYRAALRQLAESGGEPIAAGLASEADRHLSNLEALSRQLEVSVNGTADGAISPTPASLAAHLELLRIGWLRLQRLAYATGTPQLEAMTQSVIPEISRHAVILRELAVQAGCRATFREVEY